MNNPYYKEAKNKWQEGVSLARDNWRQTRSDLKAEGNWNADVRKQMRQDWKMEKSSMKADLKSNPYYADMKQQRSDWWGDNGAAIAQTGIEAIGAGVNMFGEIQDSLNDYRDMRFNAVSTMVNGVPSYGGISSIRKQYQSINPGEAGKGLGISGALQGAKVGLTAGSATGNPLGMAIGAVGGFLAGGAVGLLGKNKVQDEAKKAREKGQRAFMNAQEGYNEDVGTYYDQVDVNRQESEKLRKYQDRLYGLNKYNDPFRSII